MSVWTERVAAHGVWPAIEDLAAAVEAAAMRDALSAEMLAGIERVRAVHALVLQRLSSVDQTLLVPSTIDGLRTHLTNGTAELRAFTSDGREAHIGNANAHIDHAIGALVSIPVIVSGSEVRSLGRASADYRRTTESALQEIQDVAGEIKKSLALSEERLQAVEKEAVVVKERLEKQVSEWQAQFSTAQDSRASDFVANQSARQERFNAAVAEHQEKASQQLAEIEKTRTTMKGEGDTAVDQLSEEFGEKATALLSDMERQKEAVEKLVGVIGNLGVTSGYQTAAKAARGEKQLWQAITVVAFIAFIAFAWNAFLPVIGASFSWPSFAGRALLTVAVGLFAAYSAKQGDKSAQLEAHNRAMALELEALGPFIAPLPPDKQVAFREEVGKNAFGGSRHYLDNQADRSPTGVVDLIRDGKLQQFVTDIVKAAVSK